VANRGTEQAADLIERAAESAGASHLPAGQAARRAAQPTNNPLKMQSAPLTWTPLLTRPISTRPVELSA
jgi:hypothetical protein